MRHLAESVRLSGYDITDTLAPFQWSHNMTSKKIWHIELQENSIREWVQDKVLNVLHVKGWVNPADIFTKEMRDEAHFRRLHDSFMCCLSLFVQQSLLVIHHSHPTPQPVPHLVVPSVTSSQTFSAHKSYFSALCSSPFCRTLSAVSHLSSAGRRHLRHLHHIVPWGLI